MKKKHLKNQRFTKKSITFKKKSVYQYITKILLCILCTINVFRYLILVITNYEY